MSISLFIYTHVLLFSCQSMIISVMISYVRYPCFFIISSILTSIYYFTFFIPLINVHLNKILEISFCSIMFVVFCEFYYVISAYVRQLFRSQFVATN